MFELSATQPADLPAIENLLDSAFGPNRHAKTSYRYRVGVDPVPGLSFVARSQGTLLGSIAYYPVLIGASSDPALLLGPIAVDPALHGRGIGASLMHHSLNLAASMNHGLTVLVGDPNYYKRFGFQPASPHGIWMPDEDQNRLQLRELTEGSLAYSSGEIRHWGSVRCAAA